MKNISMDSLLKSLRDQYQSGEFETVKTTLLENKDAFDKGEFHYNLGTVYSKTGNYAVGRYHLEKAIFDGYDSVATKHNLKNVQDKLAVHDLTTSKSVNDVLLSKSMTFGTDFYVFLTLLCVLASVILINKKLVKKWVFTLMLAISLSPIVFKYAYLNNLNIAVLFDEVEVFEGPSGIFEKTGKIPGGAKVLVGKTIDGWFFIERPVDYVGWIKKKNVGVLK